MSRSSFALFLTAVGASLFAWAVLSESPAAAQDTESPKITTVDGVKLNATFYPSPKKNSPVVIMLHPVGPDKSSKGADWKRLAHTLQKSGYAVMMFDFRGHGDSTEVDPQIFWKFAPNKGMVKAKDNDTIKVEDYIKTSNGAYLPILINDIAAVKAYLDRKNDEGVCNTAKTIVIGADGGATLGAIWINSEWFRYRFTPNPMFPKVIKAGQPADRPEGENIIAAIFLTPQPKLGSQSNFSLPNVLKIACKDQGMAAYFVHGKEDAIAKKYAQTLEDKLTVKNSKKHKYISKFPLETKLSGVQLLQNALGLEKALVGGLAEIVEERGNEWGKIDARENFYIWRFGPVGPTWAHIKGELNLNYETYSRFMP